MSLYSGLLNRLKESDMNELSLTDPDSRLMKDRGRKDVCYNTHMVVDSKNHVIVEYEATNNASDNDSLVGFAAGFSGQSPNDLPQLCVRMFLELKIEFKCSATTTHWHGKS